MFWSGWFEPEISPTLVLNYPSSTCAVGIEGSSFLYAVPVRRKGFLSLWSSTDHVTTTPLLVLAVLKGLFP